MPSRNAVFLDTSGWIAILNTDDALHEKASKCLLEFGVTGRPLVTTDWVLAETGNGLARTAARSRVALAIQRFTESANCRLVRVEDKLFERAIALYDQMRDKTWGLVDCASIAVMQDHGISDALTSDRHFQQAGFHCLLPTP
jgi:predicted nucleic acid-binding protein